MGWFRRKPKYDPISFWFTCGGYGNEPCPDYARTGVVVLNATINVLTLQDKLATAGWTVAFGQLTDAVATAVGGVAAEHQAREPLCATCSTAVLDDLISSETDDAKRHTLHQIRINIAEAVRRSSA